MNRSGWSTSQKLVAYLVLLALAAASIWFVDRKVRVLPATSTTAATRP